MKKTWKIAGCVIVLGGTGVAAVACTSPTTSTLRGRVALDTFAVPPTDLVLTSSHDGQKVAPLPADGSFALVLVKGRSYQVAFKTSEGLVPLVLAGAHGQYATALEVGSGGAEADIGLVRYFANATQVEHSLRFPPLAPEPGECVDGFFSAVGEPCMSGEAQVVCTEDSDDDSDSDSDSDSDDEDDDEDDDEGWGYQGEQEGEWDDDLGEHANLVPVAGPVAVPQYSLSQGLGCDDDDSDSDSD